MHNAMSRDILLILFVSKTKRKGETKMINIIKKADEVSRGC